MSKALRELGVEIPPEEDTPFVRKLVAIIEQLVEKIHQLEGRPALPKKITASVPVVTAKNIFQFHNTATGAEPS